LTSFALALGAGGARGLAHIHVVSAFEDLGVRPSIVSGSSIGSIIGAAICSGMSASELLDYVESITVDPFGVMWDMFRVKPDSFGTFFREGGLRIGEINLERAREGLVPEDFPRDCRDRQRPLKISATN
jgi:NTE family protein